MGKNTCGDCLYYTGEECDGPGGSREGSEVYDDSSACDCFDEANDSDDSV
jgi:hypothetical protein